VPPLLEIAGEQDDAALIPFPTMMLPRKAVFGFR